MLTHWMKQFWTGLWMPITALKLTLSRRILLFWSALPVLLTFLVSIYGVAALKAWLTSLGMQYLGSLGLAPGSFTVKAVIVVFQVTLWILAVVSFSFLAGLISSPFNDTLAEQTERFAKPPLSKLTQEQTALSFKIKCIGIDLVKTFSVTALQLVLLIVGLLVALIPGVNIVVLVLAAWTLTFQFVSYPQTRRGESLKDGFLFIFKNGWACAGFGLSFGFLFTLPFISAFALPLAVVGGTLLYSQLHNRQRLPI